MVKLKEKNIKYPENLYLKDLIKQSGKSVRHIAKKCEVSEVLMHNLIAGNYKGVNIIPKIKAELGIN